MQQKLILCRKSRYGNIWVWQGEWSHSQLVDHLLARKTDKLDMRRVALLSHQRQELLYIVDDMVGTRSLQLLA